MTRRTREQCGHCLIEKHRGPGLGLIAPARWIRTAMGGHYSLPLCNEHKMVWDEAATQRERDRVRGS